MQQPQDSFFSLREKSLAVSEKKVFASFPVNSLVEVSNGCNHKCIFCFNTLMERKVGKLDLEIYQRFISQGVELGLREVGLYTTGEPFITKDLHTYIRIAKELGIVRVYVTSNGALAEIEVVKACIDAGLDSIKFSINAANKHDYALVHGRDDWDQVLSNLRAIHEYKHTQKIPLQLLGSCVMTSLTGDIRQAHREIFGDYLEEILYVHAGSQGGRNGEYVKQFSLNFEYPTIDQIQPCEMLWNRYHLTCEGYLTCCCVDYEHDLVYGDLASDTLKDAWNNDLMREMRRRHLARDLGGTICFNCLTGQNQVYGPISVTAEYSANAQDQKTAKTRRYLERVEQFKGL
jgi:MoaA/NifB/PqqE/SkfB family radical SAM enzyme